MPSAISFERPQKMQIQRSLMFLLAIFAAGPAFSLSCVKPDAVTQYEAARDSSDLYSLVIGTIQSDTPIAIPERDLSGTGSGPKSADTLARVSGRVLTAQGFTGPFDQTVTLRATCISAWCPDAPETEREVFAALRHLEGELLLEISACPTNELAWNADDEARVLNCHRFENCVIAE